MVFDTGREWLPRFGIKNDARLAEPPDAQKRAADDQQVYFSAISEFILTDL
jgi:hypothetical protein